MKILLAAGGTGGHIFPAVAVAQAIKKRRPDADVVFVGTGKDMEQQLVTGAGFPIRSLTFAPVVGRGWQGLFSLFTRFPKSLRSARALLREERPDVVIGFGGYPSVLPILSAWTLRLPRYLQEQNAQVGLANRFLSLFVDRIYAVYGARGFWFRRRVTSVENPVRHSFDVLPRWTLPNAEQRFRILVVGGSQGAMRLNDGIIKLLPLFKKHNVELFHQTGAKDFDRMKEAFAQANYTPGWFGPFIDAMPEQYAGAHLVLCRAGAMTVAEVSASARPAIFVPLQIARAHQRENVRYLEEEKACLVVEQTENFENHLYSVVEDLLAHPEKLQALVKNIHNIKRGTQLPSAELIASQLIAVAEKSSKKN